MRLILIAGLCLAVSACSPSDQSRAREDVRSAGHDVAEAASNIKNDPTVHQAGDDLKQAGHDAAFAVRKGAADAEVNTGQAMVDNGDRARRAAAQAHADSGDQSGN